MTKDVSLPEMLRLTHYYANEDTFRWFTVDHDVTVRVTFGEVRRALAREPGKDA